MHWGIYLGSPPIQGNPHATKSVLYPSPKGPRTQIIGFKGPNTIILMVFGPLNPIIWVLGPLGLGFRVQLRLWDLKL